MSNIINASTNKYPNVFVIVDESSFEFLSNMNWKATKRGYPRLSIWENKKTKHIMMHRFILGVTDSKVIVDHINGNPLANRLENLRTCTKKQNNQNRRPDVLNKSKLKGVCFDNRAGKWRSEIRSNNKAKFLGYFESSEKAALAYNIEAKKCFGEFAYLNKVGES